MQRQKTNDKDSFLNVVRLTNFGSNKWDWRFSLQDPNVFCDVTFHVTSCDRGGNFHMWIKNTTYMKESSTKVKVSIQDQNKIKDTKRSDTLNADRPLGYTAANLEGTSNTRSRIIDFLIEAKSR